MSDEEAQVVRPVQGLKPPNPLVIGSNPTENWKLFKTEIQDLLIACTARETVRRISNSNIHALPVRRSAENIQWLSL